MNWIYLNQMNVTRIQGVTARSVLKFSTIHSDEGAIPMELSQNETRITNSNVAHALAFEGNIGQQAVGCLFESLVSENDGAVLYTDYEAHGDITFIDTIF